MLPEENMFGFLKGKITVQLQGHEYRPGDTITGSTVLKLKKPRLGQLHVQLYAEDHVRSRRGGNTNREVRTAYEFSQPISEEKEFTTQEISVPISITIPTDVHSGKLDGGLGAVVQTAQLLTQTSSQRKWFIQVRFKTKGFDITKKTQINVV